MTRMFRAVCWYRIAAALGIMLGAPRIHAQTTESAVELPPFLVEETGKPLKWYKVDVPGVRLFTTCPPSTARDFTENALRQEQLLRSLIPARLLDRSTVPSYVVLIDADNAQRMADETLLQVMKTNVRATTDPLGGRPRVMPNVRLDDRDVSVILTLRQNRGPEEMEFAFAPGRIAHQIERMTPALMPWLAAGIVAVYEDCLFNYDRIQVRPLRWASPAEADALRREPDWPRDVPPLPLLFGWLPEVRDREALMRWRAQSALFVRWGIVAENGARAAGFWRFVNHCMEGGADEAAFRECFGIGFAEARDRMSDYLPQALQETVVLPKVELRPARAIPVRQAAPVEVARVRAEWDRLVVNFVGKLQPEVVPAYIEHARTSLERSRRAHPNDAALLALSGLLEYSAGDRARAVADLEAAYAAGSTRPAAASLLARLRYEEYRAELAPEERLNAAQTGFVLGPLSVTLRQTPPLPEAYLLLADMWLHSSVTPTQEDLEVLRRGLSYFPVNPAIVGRVSLLFLLQGRPAEAQLLLEESLARVVERPRRTVFENIHAHLFGTR